MDYPVILAIETSCDETSAAIISNRKILANVIATQEIHSQYGGVIPELASRNHDGFIVSVVYDALNKAKVNLSHLDAIAATQGPGLLGSLMVGYHFAKGLAFSLNKPLLGINHLHAHWASLFIDNPNPAFPILCLLVSGGHTQLILITTYTDFKILGTTLDDAAGEAYDKTAKLIGLPYPGGPLIDQLSKNGNPNAFQFSQPQIKDFDLSFSGIKTSIRYQIQDQVKANPNFIEERREDLCASVQAHINQYLIKQLKKAALAYKPQTIALAGGVSANSDLRKRTQTLAEALQIRALIPAFEYCTDNAAMIAMAAHFAYLKKEFKAWDSEPYARS